MQPTVFDKQKKRSSKRAYGAGSVEIVDPVTGTKTPNTVYIHQKKIQADDDAAFKYVTLRKLFAELQKRDPTFHPVSPPTNDDLTNFSVNHGIADTFGSLEPPPPDQYTGFTKTAKPVNLLFYPSETADQTDRFELYRDYWQHSQGGYLLIIDHPQNFHIIQEARAYLLSGGDFYGEGTQKSPGKIVDADSESRGIDRRDSDRLHDGFTFAPCPHDQKCPLPFACTHSTSHQNGFNEKTSKEIKYHEYSYVTFSVGLSREQALYNVYRRDTVERLRAGGKHYAELLGNSEELRRLLPWPRVLSLKKRRDLKTDSESEINNVTVCMPDGEWLDYDSFKLRRSTKRNKDNKFAVKVSPDIFGMLMVSKIGYRLPIFNFE